MIRIDPGRHFEIISYILQSNFLVLLIFVLSLGMLIPPLDSLFYIVITLFLYVFPFYLLFTLIINQKNGWAVGLVIWMGISLLPMLFEFETGYIQGIIEYLPLLFLVIYCVVLNIKLREWGFRQESSWFELWY